MTLFGLHVTTRRRHGAELYQVWREAGKACRALTPEQAAVVLGDVPAPREVSLSGTVVGFPVGGRRGAADGWQVAQ